ncbi:hypothetical protein NMB32_18900 [Stenotrophomonas sp. CD2]|nr:hypothetical protein NMB32_18900 [Stenotrophomonas sp. CD2]
MSVLKLVGVLLDYPREELWQHGEELLAACDDPALGAARRQQLRSFVQQLLATDALDAQAAWLASFDRGRSMSLLLFEHIHGESRDRGRPWSIWSRPTAATALNWMRASCRTTCRCCWSSWPIARQRGPRVAAPHRPYRRDAGGACRRA